MCNILNDYYVNITKDIGQPDKIYFDCNLEDIITAHSDNESVTRIKDTTGQDKHFAFELVSVNEIYNRLLKLNCKKSVGYDSVPQRLLKAGAMQLSTKLINNSITSCIFPDSLKCAEVIPIFKKDDIMNKNNYRPVTVLPCISKVYEGVLVEQLNTYFNDIFSPYLSGFRKHHSCQNVLLRYVERCKQFLDSNKFYGSFLTDLSKAFNCLPHRLLIAKLKAYGVYSDSCMLMASYFQGRRQRVKIGNYKSEWMELDKGCPQGSLMGPLAYNIFSNDLLLLICEMCVIHNYADDNTPSCWGDSEHEVVNKLEIKTSLMMDWFQSNYLQPNPEKFPFILHGNSNTNPLLQLGNEVVLRPLHDVKLLGVKIDAKLGFSEHVHDIFSKAGRKINALQRISMDLNQTAKAKVFETFIVSNFNYCPIIWHYCSLSDTQKMEKVQKRALRIVYNDYDSSYKDLRVKSKRPLMYTQRLRLILSEMHKIYHGFGPEYMKDFVKRVIVCILQGILNG